MSVTHRPRLRPVFRISSRNSFWVILVAYLGLMLAASAPSALYVTYQEKFHFSDITLTTIFGVYAVALLLTLLTVGGLSDFVGRKPVLLAGFVLLIASMVVFANADGVAWLYAGRVLQGLAAGLAIGTLSAGMIDTAGPDRLRFANLANSFVPSMGLALGALVAGGLVRFAPAPTTLVYVVLAAFFALLMVGIGAGPESEQRRPGALKSLAPRMRVAPGIRGEFVRRVSALLAPWAQFGLTLSLTTTVAAVKFGVTDVFSGAVLVAAVFGAGCIAVFLISDLPVALATRLGSVAMVLGVAISLVGLGETWTLWFYVGSAVGGLGAGATMGATIRALSALPAHAERGEFFASVYVVGYLAFSVPTVVAGWSAVHVGLETTMFGYGIGVIALALVAAVSVRSPATAVAAAERHGIAQYGADAAGQFACPAAGERVLAAYSE